MYLEQSTLFGHHGIQQQLVLFQSWWQVLSVLSHEPSLVKLETPLSYQNEYWYRLTNQCQTIIASSTSDPPMEGNNLMPNILLQGVILVPIPRDRCGSKKNPLVRSTMAELKKQTTE